MGTESRALLTPIMIAWATLTSFGCAPRAAESSVAEMRRQADIPKYAPGVEVEVLAAQRAGRGDAHVFFLLGRNGKVEKTGSFGIGSIALFAPPTVTPEQANPEHAPVTLSEADANALRAAIEGAILAATMPKLFDPPSAFLRTNGRPWRAVHPPVRLRVDPAWLDSESERFDGTWVTITPPALPAPDRVVVNVVGWRYSMRRSRPFEIALSRGFLSETWVELPLRGGPKAREMNEAVRNRRLDETLPEREPTPWKAIAGPLQIEVDRAWLESGGPLDLERWTLIEPRPPS